MRGKVTDAPHAVFRFGITPAHAGKSRLACTEKRRSRDHPRACGEKHGADRLSAFTAGKVGIEGIVIRHEGITPAHAGKSIFCTESIPSHKDHPRACGEKPALG